MQEKTDFSNIWLKAAYNVLTKQGVEAVKVMTLAKKLNVTRTSFYWYFASRDALLETIVQHWENKNTGNLIQQTKLEAKTISTAMLNIFDCWVDDNLFDARLDLAIRNWARNDHKLEKRLEKADNMRINAIANMFERFGYTPDQADVRSKTIIYTQIGYIFMQVTDDIEHRFLRMPGYIEVFTGTLPSENELADFRRRHRIGHA